MNKCCGKKCCDCCNKDKLCQWLKDHWLLFPAALLAAFGLFNGQVPLALGGMIAGVIIYELQEIKKILKNTCWY